jgi:hypothetical protein
MEDSETEGFIRTNHLGTVDQMSVLQIRPWLWNDMLATYLHTVI